MSDIELPHIAGGDRLIVVVGASGAGKDSLLRAWRARLGSADIRFVRRVITRAADANEDHEPVTEADFDALRAAGLLATWWRAHGLSYGIRTSELAGLDHGGWAVINGSREHLPAMRLQAPGLRVVEVTAPVDVLAARLASRAREDTQGRAERLQRRVEAPVAPSLRLVNDGALQRCVQELELWWLSLSTISGRR